jgi:hypothetical protein
VTAELPKLDAALSEYEETVRQAAIANHKALEKVAQDFHAHALAEYERLCAAGIAAFNKQP